MSLNKICLSDVVGSHTEVWLGDGKSIALVAEVLSSTEVAVMFHVSHAPGNASVAWLHVVPGIPDLQDRDRYVLRGIFETERGEKEFEAFFEAARRYALPTELSELTNRRAANDPNH